MMRDFTDFDRFAADASLLESTHKVFQVHKDWWTYEEADGRVVTNVSLMLRVGSTGGLDMSWIKDPDYVGAKESWWHYGGHYHIYTRSVWSDIYFVMRAYETDKAFFGRALSFLRRFER